MTATLYVYWCRECLIQSPTRFHRVEGRSLSQGAAAQHECEKIEVVPIVVAADLLVENQEEREQLDALAAQADRDGERVKAEVIEALESWGIDWYGPNAAYKPAQKQARRALALIKGCRVVAEYDRGGEMAEETRPSTPVKFPLDPDALVADASTVELLTTCMERLRHERDGSANVIARELSTAITHIEDAITRTNKAHYRSRGVYAITDAER